MSEDSIIEALADEIIELVLANVVCNVDCYTPEDAEVEAIPQLHEDIEVRAKVKRILRFSIERRVKIEQHVFNPSDS